MRDYKNTLNLPQTDFSMRANLKEKELKILSFWKETDIYKKMLEKGDLNKIFILHDGPPYSNASIHIGHALNKILKDIIIKYKSFLGYRVPFICGWDCHGLPVELQLMKELNITSKEQIDVLDFRKKATDFALKFAQIQKEEFERLGVFSDWSTSYYTLSPKYEAEVIRLFAELVEKGFIYRGLKPVNWCKHCQTALAEAEVEYKNKTSPSIYVLFEVKDQKTFPQNTYFLVWTTTPWTLVSNTALAVNPTAEYVLISLENKYIIILKDLKEKILEKVKIKNCKVLKEFKGKDLEGILTQHPFIDRTSPVVLGDFVSKEEGTGIVHIAPGFGQEDFELGLKYNLDILVPVDEKGRFKEEDFVPQDLRNKDVHTADDLIIEILKQKDKLFISENITHSYPHCWRCKKPLIFRATEQTFLNIEKNNLRKNLLKEIEKIRWIPPQGKERIYAMVSERPDWCLSRQRIWGLGIPAFICKDCNFYILDKDLILKIADLIEKEGSNIWFEKPVSFFLGSDYKCPRCKSKNLKKGTDVLDVWFESGASFRAVLMKREELKFPADIYLEGSDQHRGWFQVSLILSYATQNKAPFRDVLTHGFVVDEKGRKMSKSLGNVIKPQDIWTKYGAEILRLWACSANYHLDIKISSDIILRIVDFYRKVRNTFRFLLGNLYDFSPTKDMIDFSNLLYLDKIFLSKLSELTLKIKKFYEEYAFYKIYQNVYNYCVNILSAIYFDILKERLYTHPKKSNSRLSCQTVLFYILRTLVRILAPIMSFTCEEVWQHMRKMGFEEKESVFLSNWPKEVEDFLDKSLLKDLERLLLLRDKVNKALEIKRQEGLIRASLEAELDIYLPKEDLDFFKGLDITWREFFIVSKVNFSEGKERIIVEKAKGQKCQRCWCIDESVGTDTEFPDLCRRCIKFLKEAEYGKKT